MKKQTPPYPGIYIRKSLNPLKKTSYAVYFRKGGKYIAKHATDNGNIVDLGHIINNFLNHDSMPIDAYSYIEEMRPTKPEEPAPELLKQGDLITLPTKTGKAKAIPFVTPEQEKARLEYERAYLNYLATLTTK